MTAMWWLCPSCLNAFEENIGPHHAADDEAQVPDCGTDLILVAPVDLAVVQAGLALSRANSEADAKSRKDRPDA